MWQPGQSRDKPLAVVGPKEVTREGEAPQAHPGWTCRAELPYGSGGALGHIIALNNKGVVPCFWLGKKGRTKKAKISKTKSSKKKKKRWIFGLNSLADLALQSHNCNLARPS